MFVWVEGLGFRAVSLRLVGSGVWAFGFVSLGQDPVIVEFLMLGAVCFLCMGQALKPKA